MNKIRAGIIGMGVGEQHIAGYHSHPACSVVGLCEFDQDKQRIMKEKYPGMDVCSSDTCLLDNPEIDVVSIASYDNYHYEQIVKAIENDKHVFVEKPLCLYEEQARHIRELLNNKPHLKMSSNLILRKSPRFMDLKDRISIGQLGELYHIEGDYNYGRLHKITRGWRGRIDFYSVVYGGGVHIIDLMLWLTGQEIVEVASYGNNISTRGSQYKYNDLVVSILKFSGGMTGKVTSNYSCVYPHFHRLSVYGTDGTFENRIECGLLYKSSNPGKRPLEVKTDYPGAHKGAFLYSFIDAIDKESEPEITADDVFRTMSVCFAVEKSMQAGGESVKVDYI